MGPISSKAKSKFDLDTAQKFLAGSGNKYQLYLNHFYEKDLEGDNETKFKLFTELIVANE